MKEYIAIDISKSSLDVYDGKKSYKFTNDKNGFYSIVKLCSDIKNIVLIYEPTGVYSHAITKFCEANNIAVVMVGPKVARDFSRSLKVRSKTDKIDAKVLFKYQVNVDENMIKVPKIDYDGLKVNEMLNSYELFKEMIARLKNQLEAIDKNNTELITVIKKEITTLLETSDKLFDEIESIILKDENMKMKYNALCTIPAINRKSAIYLIINFLKYPSANAKEITALLGLDPVFKESGNYKGNSKISKQGGKSLRDMLFLPTLCATQHNHKIKTFYQRLLTNNKPKKLAVTASMRKLMLLAFSIFKSGLKFQTSIN